MSERGLSRRERNIGARPPRPSARRTPNAATRRARPTPCPTSLCPTTPSSTGPADGTPARRLRAGMGLTQAILSRRAVRASTRGERPLGSRRGARHRPGTAPAPQMPPTDDPAKSQARLRLESQPEPGSEGPCHLPPQDLLCEDGSERSSRPMRADAILAKGWARDRTCTRSHALQRGPGRPLPPAVVAYTWREGRYRIISARGERTDKRRAYEILFS